VARRLPKSSGPASKDDSVKGEHGAPSTPTGSTSSAASKTSTTAHHEQEKHTKKKSHGHGHASTHPAQTAAKVADPVDPEPVKQQWDVSLAKGIKEGDENMDAVMIEMVPIGPPIGEHTDDELAEGLESTSLGV